MAFLDNLGAKMSQMGQKTKDYTEINRLKGLMGDEEREIAKLKMQIGETYLALHADDPEERLAGMVSAIKAAQGKIADYQSQISTLRGVRQCPNCGADVEPGVLFCAKCGTAMPQPEPPVGMVFCPACGAQVPEGSKFCKACGAPMLAPAPKANVCPNCGAPVAPGVLFCAKCGQKL